MKDTLLQNAEAIARDWPGLALAGLGVTFMPHEWLGGLFLALAGASLATAIDTESRRLGLFGTMVAAFFISHVASIAAQAYYPPLSPQLVMAGAGFASRYVARLALRVLHRVDARGDSIADSLINRAIPPHVPPFPPAAPPAPPVPPVEEETRP